jgi:hypothetical protein
VDQAGREVGIETANLPDVGRPEDIATAVAFLACDKAAFVQGAVLRMDSGRLDRLQPPTNVHHWPKPITHAPALMDQVVETNGGARAAACAVPRPHFRAHCRDGRETSRSHPR